MMHTTPTSDHPSQRDKTALDRRPVAPSKVQRIVLTGGPCAGKTTVINVLVTEFCHRIEIVPEAASEVFAAGHKLPDASWTEHDWLALQEIITKRQLKLEIEAEARAKTRGITVIVCDRAPYDNLAYPMGEIAVTNILGANHSEGMNRYSTVIHLQSLAVTDPRNYARVCRNNAGRVEDAAAAVLQEARTLTAWDKHPNRIIIDDTTLHEVTARCREIIISLMPR